MSKPVLNMVSFSGGKDSTVTADLAVRALSDPYGRGKYDINVVEFEDNRANTARIEERERCAKNITDKIEGDEDARALAVLIALGEIAPSDTKEVRKQKVQALNAKILEFHKSVESGYFRSFPSGALTKSE